MGHFGSHWRGSEWKGSSWMNTWGDDANPPVLHTLTYDPDTFEMLGVKTGTGSLSNGRGSSRYVRDYQGIYQFVNAGRPAWHGARAVPDPDKLFSTFAVSATSPDPLVNLRMSFNDGSTWRIHTDDITTESLASGSIHTVPGLSEGDSISFYAGDAAALIWFYVNSNQLTGSIPDLSSNTALLRFYCNTNQLTGSIPDLSSNTALTYFYCYSNQLTGSIPDLSSNTVLQIFRCYENLLTGSIPDLSSNTALTQFYCYENLLTGFVGGWPNKAFNFNASDNALTEAAVNQILIDADTYGVASGTTINLSGGTNAVPTGAGATAKANLISGGATVTTN